MAALANRAGIGIGTHHFNGDQRQPVDAGVGG